MKILNQTLTSTSLRITQDHRKNVKSLWQTSTFIPFPSSHRPSASHWRSSLLTSTHQQYIPVLATTSTPVLPSLFSLLRRLHPPHRLTRSHHTTLLHLQPQVRLPLHHTRTHTQPRILAPTLLPVSSIQSPRRGARKEGKGGNHEESNEKVTLAELAVTF